MVGIFEYLADHSPIKIFGSILGGIAALIAIILFLSPYLVEPPIEPNNPYPSDGANHVDLDEILKWHGGGGGDEVSYSIYWGTNINNLQYINDVKGLGREIHFNHSNNNFESGKTYYWKIIARKDKRKDDPVEGPIWKFSTKIVLKPIHLNLEENINNIEKLNRNQEQSDDESPQGTLWIDSNIMGVKLSSATTYAQLPICLSLSLTESGDVNLRDQPVGSLINIKNYIGNLITGDHVCCYSYPRYQCSLGVHKIWCTIDSAHGSYDTNPIFINII